jgi:hypothetical protein
LITVDVAFSRHFTQVAAVKTSFDEATPMKTIRPDCSARGASGVASVEPEELIREDKAAKLFGVRPGTLADWRREKRGPMFLKLGRHAYYRRADISAWLAAQLRDPRAA